MKATEEDSIKQRERVNIILPGDKEDVTMMLRKIFQSVCTMSYIKTYLKKLQNSNQPNRL